MNLILARHGNTFEADQKPYWVGSKNDIPLTSTGKEQAEKLAEYLINNKLIPDAIYCGPLKRTKDYAKIISKITELKKDPIIDDRLNELDYGDWSGLETQRTIELYGEDTVKDWENNLKWPSKDKGNWPSSQDETIKKVESFIEHINNTYSDNQNIIIVTSNGILRHFWLILDGDKKSVSKNGKVKTGAFCQIQLSKTKTDSNKILSWNKTL